MDDQVFADGIGTISVIGGTVRVDFVTYSPTQTDPAGQPAAVFRQRIIMGTEAFLATAEKFQEAAQRLSLRPPRTEPQPALHSVTETPPAPPPAEEPAPAAAKPISRPFP